MGYQAVFKRYEIKYMVTAEQKARIQKAMEPYMELDRFGRSTVRNIYFDTDDFVLARHSIAKPDYKEKLRIRSYSKADADSTVFVELKRKFDGVVYKRRIGLPETDAMKWMAGSRDPAIMRETGCRITAGRKRDRVLQRPVQRTEAGPLSELRPRSLQNEKRSIDRRRRHRIQSHIRQQHPLQRGDLSLRSDPYGTQILEDGMFLMELKCPGAIPMWMTKILSEERLYKTSFSKYGTAYCSFMDKAPGERAHEIAAAGYENYAAAKCRPGTNYPRARSRTCRQAPA